MFAKLAVTELRARQGVCSGECRYEDRKQVWGWRDEPYSSSSLICIISYLFKNCVS